MGFRGTCHCGRFVFEVHGGAASQGGLLSVPRDQLRLLSSEEGVGAYTVGGRTIVHRFCGACGTHLYGEEVGGAGPGTAYVNPRCIVGDSREPDLAKSD